MTHIAYSLNVGGKLMDLSKPRVMGILNITPDSFHISINPHRDDAERDIARQVGQMLADGADIIDIGGCSTRPGSEPASCDEEWHRVRMALEVVRHESYDQVVSVDTFRPEIARRAIEEYGINIVNDISGGGDVMYDIVAHYGVPYILTFNEPRRRDWAIGKQALMFFAQRIEQLRGRGQKDIVLDPGFGFNKTVNENFELMANLESLRIFGLPLLVGISHKRMIYETLQCSHDQAANGTSVLNVAALERGASILRVHNVKDAAECIQLWSKIEENKLRIKS